MIKSKSVKHLRSILVTLIFTNLNYFVTGSPVIERTKREVSENPWWRSKVENGENAKFRISYRSTQTFLTFNENNILVVPRDAGYHVPHFQICSSSDNNICHYDEEREEERHVEFDGQHNVILSKVNGTYQFPKLDIVEDTGHSPRGLINLRFNESRYVTVEDGNYEYPQFRLNLTRQVDRSRFSFILCTIDSACPIID